MDDTSRRTHPDEGAASQEWDEAAFEELDAEEPYFDEPVFEESNVDDEAYSFDELQPDEPMAESWDDSSELRSSSLYRQSMRGDEEPRLSASKGSFTSKIAPLLSGAVAMWELLRYQIGHRILKRPYQGKDAGGSSLFSRDHFAGASSAGRRLGRTGPFWMMAAGVAVVLMLAVALGVMRDDGDADGTEEQSSAAPIIADSTSVPAESAALDATPELPPTPTAEPVLSLGQRVLIGNTGGQGIRLRNEPGTAGLTLAIYQDGSQFTIINPDGDYSSYPVEADGYRWYRIQVVDNPDEDLTGWAAADFLLPAEE